MTRQTWLLAAALLTGCSAIPPGGDPAQDPDVRAIAAQAGPKHGRIAVAPVTSIGLATDEAAKGWQPSETTAIEPEKVRADLVKALEASGAYDHVRPTGPEPLAEAWKEKEDYVATLTIDNLRTTYDGHYTGLYILNIANWLMWIVPSWFVATEKYSLAFDATVTIQSAESGAVVAQRPVLRKNGKPIVVEGDFDELDRGWQFFGFIGPSFDKDVWRGIATKLFPAAQTELAAAATRTIDEALRAAEPTKELVETRRKTLALVIGISRYQDPVALPPLASAADDARAVASALESRGVAREHTLVLTDSAATVAGMRAAVADHLSRAKEGDTTLVYFAGYGSRHDDGSPELLFSETNLQGSEGALGLDELGILLRDVKGEKLLLVDASFGGRSRAIVNPKAQAAKDDLAALGGVPGLATILACGPSDPALAPEHLGGGLFTYHLVRGLRGAADEDHDGRIGAKELFNFVRPCVVRESSLLGSSERETPRGIGLDSNWVLEPPQSEARRAP